MAHRRSVRGLVTGAVLLAVALHAPAALALDPTKALTQYVRDGWGLRDGLPQLSVRDIAQTADGYLWLATEEGLARFDGVRFTVFDDGNAQGLRSHDIQALLAGRDGSLWIGTTGGGLSRLRDGVLTTIGPGDGLGSDSVQALYEDAGGALWAGTPHAGLARFDGQAWRRYGAADGLPEGGITALEGGADGRLWVATPHAVSRLEGGRFRAYVVPGETGGVTTLRGDGRGRLWVGTHHGLWRLEGERLVRPAGSDGLSALDVQAIAHDRDGNLWLGTDRGLRRWRDGSPGADEPKEGLAHTVFALREDREGGLWIGTYGAGLLRLRDGEFRAWSRPEGLPHDFARSVFEDGRGDLWVGTRGGGLARIRDGQASVPPEVQRLSASFVYAVTGTRDGALWVGTYGGGLVRVGDRGTTVYTTRDGLGSDLVRALYEDRSGALWVATDGGGLARWDGRRFLRYGPGEGLSADRVYCLLEDARGDLLAGTDDGILRLHEGRFAPMGQALPGRMVRSLHEDARGVLWVGTTVGLARIDHGHLTAYSRKEELGDAVFAILEDGSGSFWLSGNRGVWRVSGAELEAVAAGKAAVVRPKLFGVADGLKSRECNGGTQPAAWKGHDGRLWFPTMAGVAVVDPRHGPVRVPAPAPLVEEATVNGQALDLRRPRRIPPGPGRLELRYTALFLSTPERIRFRYRLSGFDREWIEAGAQRVAQYTNLPPGRYRFQVMACLDAVCSAAPAGTELELAPRFFQTWAFLGMVGLLAAATVWGGHRFRVRRLRAREHELVRRIQEAVSRVKVLSGLLPMCAWCKKIRDDGGYWNQLETYIKSHTHAEFTHGICPDCRKALAAPAEVTPAEAVPAPMAVRPEGVVAK